MVVHCLRIFLRDAAVRQRREEGNFHDDNEEGEEDNVEEREESTDTEQEFEDVETQLDSHREDRLIFTGKDGTTIWRKHPLRKMVRRSAKKYSDSSAWYLIIENTNKYLASASDNYGRETYTRPTNKIEIQALLGILLLSGVKKCNHLNAEDLFKTNGTVPEILRLVMSCQRFRILLRYLRVDDMATRAERQSATKLASCRILFESIVENCKKNCSMSHYVTVDEKLEGFRGRCAFRQYIPSKPNKYGIKIYALSDAKMYYTANLEVYVGTQPEGPFSVSNSALALVDRLCQPIRGTGRNLTTDNFFTSLELAELLLSQKITTVGTIRKKQTSIATRICKLEEPAYCYKHVCLQR
ncbi:hypothetical protein NQ314_018715 [Rhamnusium bicolor]|uniref:PiggyBac transposable element-derived protein domain-containing protein n=1 Tax=Rhamnusium bicolor TaxID=1586634 RepID=A0AAV8WPJ7_9CUCU|nr:hypothetical protein NQ314_018715 [Rhamnusium bicolor]